MKPSKSDLHYDLSVIVVSYNTIQMTRECLASISREKTGFSIQIIVVDNNSKDGSVEMVKTEYPYVTLVENTENRGFAAANNQGLNLCLGDFVLLLNSDTIVLDTVLRDSVRYLQANQEVGAMACQVLNSDYTIQMTCSGFPTVLRLLLTTLALDRFPALPSLDRYLMRSWRRSDEREVEVINGCFLLTSKAVVNSVGHLDENFFFFGEETDWCRRIRDAGWKLVFSPLGRIIHHGGGSVSKLDYKRDVILTSSLVRLQIKHGGLLRGVLAFLILMFFNLSRAFFWGIISLFSQSKRDRAGYFLRVVLSIRSCWPNSRPL